MNQTAINYGKVLFLLGMDRQTVAEAEEIWKQSEPLREVMESPVVKAGEKHRLIERIFPEEIQVFLKVVCDNREMDLLPDMFQAYETWYDDSEKIRRGILYYVEKPEKEQLARIEKKLCSQLKCSEVKLALEPLPELIGGFVIRIGDLEIDRSLRGSINCMKEKLITGTPQV